MILKEIGRIQFTKLKVPMSAPGEILVVKLGNYESDPHKAAVIAEDEHGQPVEAISTNTHHAMEPGEFVVAAHKISEERLQLYLAARFFIDTGKKVDFGHVKNAPVLRVADEEDCKLFKKIEFGESKEPTGWAVICCRGGHGRVFLTRDEYSRQMMAPDSRWECPRCGEEAGFDDDTYEKWCNEQAEKNQPPPEEE